MPAPQIILSSTVIDEGQAAGTVYALVSVLEPRATISLSSLSINDGVSAGTALATMAVGMPWTYTLIEAAGGRFALSGSSLVAGVTPLDAITRPTETITIAATDGKRTVRRTFTITVRKALPALPMAAGAKVMGFGHSYVGRSGYAIATGAVPYTRVDTSTGGWVGDLGSLRALDRRFNVDTWLIRRRPSELLRQPECFRWFYRRCRGLENRRSARLHRLCHCTPAGDHRPRYHHQRHQ